MKLKLVVVGKDRQDPTVQLAEAYLARVQRYLPAESVEIKETPLRKGQNAKVVQRQEAERLKAAIGSCQFYVALDVTGKALSSEALAEKLGQWMDAGTGEVALLIGGPTGLDAALVEGARERWSLSKLTLPHRLARLVLCEQLYRAQTILRGEPYHK